MSTRERTVRGAPARAIGVIDIGTNSVKLTVGSVVNGRVMVLHTAREATRLGRGLARSGRIQAATANRTAVAVKRLAIMAQTVGASDVIAVGTYALRSARNGRAVARAISRAAEVPVRILSGAEEASMVLASVRARVRRPRKHLMVVDIGGGSAEFIVTRNQRALAARSVPLGAVGLTERYLFQDPVDPDEYSRMLAEIDRVVSGLFALIPNLRPATVDLVASGGSATTAASMAQGSLGEDPGMVPLATLRLLEARCLAASIEERRGFPGLLPDRADIMPAGLAVLIAFARHARKRSMRMIEGGVRDGVILERAQAASRSPRRTHSTARRSKAARKGR